jgi:hypothetical protein
VKDGDSVYAFVYADQTAWSDTYSFFDKNTVTAQAGEVIELTLSYSGYDANWNTVVMPLEGAEITADGEATGLVTDAEGKVTFMVDEAGEYVLSAVSADKTLVPPVCVITITGEMTDEEGNQDVPVVPENDDTAATDDEQLLEDEPAAEEETDGTTQTGDDFNIALYGFVALAALATASFCLRRKTCK